MTILRTALATLVLVAMAGLAHAGDCQKADDCYEKAGCSTKCDTVKYQGNCYSSKCVTVCLPTRPCKPFKDPSCGCDKEKGGCDPVDPCDPSDGKEKDDDCTCGKGLFKRLIGECCSCRSRVKKRLMVKKVVVCEEPTLKCEADDDKGK